MEPIRPKRNVLPVQEEADLFSFSVILGNQPEQQNPEPKKKPKKRRKKPTQESKVVTPPKDPDGFKWGGKQQW